MRPNWMMIAVALLCLTSPRAYAHRLDEYLQATTIFVDKDHVGGLIRLTPGVDVLPIVLPTIDTNGDGIISPVEQQAYARRVLGDLSLKIDGHPLSIQLVSATFGTIDDMKEGLGEIDIHFTADLPPGGPNRALLFDNHHQSKIAAYMVNCLAPNDPDVRVVTQRRNYEQSLYELDYVASRLTSPSSRTPASLSRKRAILIGNASMLLLGTIAFAWRRARLFRGRSPAGSVRAD